MPRLRPGLLALLLLAGCGPAPSPQERAIQAAYGEARSRFDYAQDIRRLPPGVEDRGDRWRIQFRPAPGMIGGDVLVEVRKSDMAILLAVAGQ
jgi:hypothetical protein